MRQRTSGTEHDYYSNARFLYRSQGLLHVEGIETFNTEIIMAPTQGKTFKFLDTEFIFVKNFIVHNQTTRDPKLPAVL